MSVVSPSKVALIYIKNNGANHTDMGVRVFGGLRGNSSNVVMGYPKVEVTGMPLERTWSLLAATRRVVRYAFCDTCTHTPTLPLLVSLTVAHL